MDVELNVMREVYTHRSLETEGNACHAGPRGERTRIGQQAESEGRGWPRNFTGIFTGSWGEVR